MQLELEFPDEVSWEKRRERDLMLRQLICYLRTKIFCSAVEINVIDSLKELLDKYSTDKDLQSFLRQEIHIHSLIYLNK